MTRVFTALLCASGLTFAAQAFTADEAEAAVCKQRGEIIKILNKRYGETRRSFGLQNNRRILEVYASETGTWTAILTMPSGRSCVVAAGEAWTDLPPVPLGEPA